ncbi:MAG: hypothetical protein AAGK78_15205, partial [Planctomycetota bacterium]
MGRPVREGRLRRQLKRVARAVDLADRRRDGQSIDLGGRNVGNGQAWNIEHLPLTQAKPFAESVLDGAVVVFTLPNHAHEVVGNEVARRPRPAVAEVVGHRDVGQPKRAVRSDRGHGTAHPQLKSSQVGLF